MLPKLNIWKALTTIAATIIAGGFVSGVAKADTSKHEAISGNSFESRLALVRDTIAQRQASQTSNSLISQNSTEKNSEEILISQSWTDIWDNWSQYTPDWNNWTNSWGWQDIWDDY
ncbi:MAG: hypothetical protein ACFE0I_18960 [Elainellaceae cyanobacterium]